MRKIFLLAFTLLLISLASAEVLETQTKLLNVGETVDVYTRKITLLNVGSTGAATVDIDNYTTKIIQDTWSGEGLEINTSTYFYAPVKEERTIELIISTYWKHDCEEDSECEDYDDCTFDQCTGYPRSCDNDDSHVNITTCVNEDGCCPLGCNYPIGILTEDKDSDCEQYSCDKDSDCDDRDFCTEDSCPGGGDICEFEPIILCESDDRCCPDSCYWTVSLIPERDGDCSKENLCNSSSECNDNNTCTIDTCESRTLWTTDVKDCYYTNISSCTSGDGCCPANCDDSTDSDCSHSVKCGDSLCESPENCATCSTDCGVCRESEVIEVKTLNCDVEGEMRDINKLPYYCYDSAWSMQKTKGVSCLENYECLNNICKGEVCAEESKSKGFDLRIVWIFLAGVMTYIIVTYKFLKRKPER